MERKGIVTFGGNPLTLAGNEVKVGDKAPEFTVIDKDLSEVRHLRGFIQEMSERSWDPYFE